MLTDHWTERLALVLAVQLHHLPRLAPRALTSPRGGPRRHVTRFYDPTAHLAAAQPEDAAHFVEMIAGDAPIRVRLLHHRRKQDVVEIEGRLAELHPKIAAHTAAGGDAYLVANETAQGVTGRGGTAQDPDVTRIRVLFVDSDGGTPPPETWHAEPSLVMVRHGLDRLLPGGGREEGQLEGWWAIWGVEGLEVSEFRDAQRRLALHYDTDPSVINPSRVIRLPGYRHGKSGGPGYRIVSATGGVHEACFATAGLPELPPIRTGGTAGEPFPFDIARDMLAHIRWEPTARKMRPSWCAIGGALYDAKLVDADGSPVGPEAAFELFHDWCSGALWGGPPPGEYQGRDDCADAWRSFGRGALNKAGMGTVRHHAQQGAYSGPAGFTSAREAFDGHFDKPGDPEPSPFPRLKRVKDAKRDRRRYLWAGMVLERSVTLSPGDGNVGKGRLWTSAGVAVAAALEELYGLKIDRPMPVVFVSADGDDEAELHRRAEGIAGELGLPGVPDNFHMIPLVDDCDEPVELVYADRDGNLHPGKFLDHLKKELAPLGEHLLILDAASDMADIDENHKGQVLRFLKQYVRGLCKEPEHGGVRSTVVLLYHPSKTASKDRTFVSTPGWRAGVRSMVVGERVKPEKGGWKPDPESRGPVYFARFRQDKGNNQETSPPCLILQSVLGRCGFVMAGEPAGRPDTGEVEELIKAQEKQWLQKWAEIVVDDMRAKKVSEIGVYTAAGVLAKAAEEWPAAARGEVGFFGEKPGTTRSQSSFRKYLAGERGPAVKSLKIDTHDGRYTLRREIKKRGGKDHCVLIPTYNTLDGEK